MSGDNIIPVPLTQEEIDYLWDWLFDSTQQLFRDLPPMHYGIMHKLAVAGLITEGGNNGT
jgi:hypothetical protein